MIGLLVGLAIAAAVAVIAFTLLNDSGGQVRDASETIQTCGTIPLTSDPQVCLPPSFAKSQDGLIPLPGGKCYRERDKCYMVSNQKSFFPPGTLILVLNGLQIKLFDESLNSPSDLAYEMLSDDRIEFWYITEGDETICEITFKDVPALTLKPDGPCLDQRFGALETVIIQYGTPDSLEIPAGKHSLTLKTGRKTKQYLDILTIQ